jgi:hypothetical protein
VQSIQQVICWMHSLSLVGLWRILHRFHLVSNPGQLSVHSPDPLYREKRAAMERAQDLALQAAREVVFL